MKDTKPKSWIGRQSFELIADENTSKIYLINRTKFPCHARYSNEVDGTMKFEIVVCTNVNAKTAPLLH